MRAALDRQLLRLAMERDFGLVIVAGSASHSASGGRWVRLRRIDKDVFHRLFCCRFGEER